MARRKLLKHLIFLMFFIFLAQEGGVRLHFDSLLWYFDVIMHFLGGVWVGLFFLYVFSFTELKAKNHLFAQVLVATLTAGVVWEIYEYYLDVVGGTSYVQFADTAWDIFFDALGSFAAILYFKILLRGGGNVQSG